jgi:hypothetical protein
MNINDITATLQAMRIQEAKGYQCSDYLCSQRRPKNLKRPQAGICHALPVDAECRFKMAEWCYQVVDFCKFSRETVSIAMSYLDRYLATEVGAPALIDRKVFQLAAMTSLYTAIKIHEPEAMEPKVVANLSRGTYAEQQVIDMELSILGAIQWRMNPPTALSFINSLFALLPEGIMSQAERDAVYELCKYQTELAVNESSLIAVDASIIAFGALLNALETVTGGSCMDVVGALAKAAGIHADSIVVIETQDKLYQAVSRISTTGPAVSHLAPKSPVVKCIGRRGSVHVSPRSVVNSQ